MAVVTRPTPDEFNNPVARTAPDKGRIVNILNLTRRLGESVVSLLTGLLAAALILYSGYVLYDSFYTQNTAGSTNWDLLQYKPEIMTDGATPLSGGGTLAAINADYRSWLTMYDTNIDYAVMQGEDDLYYATHDIYGENSITGAIYLASGNAGGFTDPYNLIYGHHMDNGAMFGALDSFASESYFDSHREGVIVSTSGVYDLYTFAVVRTHAYEAKVYNVGGKSAEDIIHFIENAEGTVIYRQGIANANSKIVALSTCAAADTDGRLVVFAVMLPHNMTETTTGLLTIAVNTYEGVYDGLWHGIDVTVNDPAALIEYSTDGGATWTTARPLIRDVGTIQLSVRASREGLETVTAVSLMRVTPAAVVVTAQDASKVVGADDPAFTAVVTGLIGNDTIVYTVTRPRAGQDEAVGRYNDTIIPAGAAVQGNYTVTYIPADFTITAVDAVEVIEDPDPPLAAFVRRFDPTGSSYGGRAWALVNLICLIVTAYLLLPLLHLKAKYGRSKLVGKLNKEEEQICELDERENEEFEKMTKKFKRRFAIGVALELIDVVLALVTFILTEDMRNPMVLIDRWTPLMVLFLVICWVIDVRAIRIRDKEILDEAERSEDEAAAAPTEG